MIKLLTWGFLLTLVFSDLILLNKHLTNPQEYQSYKKQLIFNQMSNKMIQKQLVFNKQYHWCYIPIANSLIPSQPFQITREQDFNKYKKYLDPLQNLCDIYYTRQFLYDFCYGYQVRQLDDQTTKANMGKPEFENFLLGKSNNLINPSSNNIKEQQKIQFVHIKDRIGRLSFRFNKQDMTYNSNYLNNTQLLTLVCTNLNNLNIQLVIMWISSSDFIVLDQFQQQCFASNVIHSIVDNQRILRIQKQYQSFVKSLYLIDPRFQYAFLIKNNTAELLQPQFLSKQYLRFNNNSISAKDLGFVLQIDHSQTITQKMTYKQMFTKLRYKDKIIVIYNNQTIQKLSVTNVNPLLFSSNTKIDQKKLIDIYRIEKRKTRNITLNKTDDPISFIKLLAGDTIYDIDSNQCISVESMHGQPIKLVQQDGWEYYLMNKHSSFRVRTNKFNYSKEIENQNRYFQNITTHVFLICGAIWGIEDLIDYAQPFYRLPIKGKYSIVSEDHVYVKYYNLDHKYSKIKKPQIIQIDLQKGLEIFQYYQQGDACSQNLFRSTKVVYQCGDSWFTIAQVSQEKICTYEIRVETRLLCPANATFNINVQQNIDTICFNEEIRAETN